jgi:hypothetical protein
MSVDTDFKQRARHIVLCELTNDDCEFYSIDSCISDIEKELLNLYCETKKATYDACAKELNEVEQLLGKALNYFWYKDDQKNFPGATEKDGVCVGEHVPASIAAEAANTITHFNRTFALMSKALEQGETQPIFEAIRKWEESYGRNYKSS